MSMTLAQVGAMLRPRRLLSFSVLHAFNAVINLFYTFVQLVVFARVLPQDDYSRIVLLTAVGIYFMPLSQAVGRANFVALRESFVKGGEPRHKEAVALLYAQGLLLFASSVAVSWMLGWRSTTSGVAEWLYLLFCLFTNYWYMDLQSTLWAVELGRKFEILSLMRRLVNFAALAAIWLTHDFLMFGALTCAANIVFIAVLVRMASSQDAPLSFRLSFADIRTLSIVRHLKLLWSSLLSTLSELLILNSPYALLSARFGVGNALVAFDTVMKLARLSMGMSRNLAEIALPKQSRLMVEGDKAAARRLFLQVTGLCVLAGTGVAGFILVMGPRVFRLLLGPNDVIPAGAAYVAAAIVMVSAFYQPAIYFLSFTNAQKAIRILTVYALVGFGGYAVALLALDLSVVASLVAYLVYFACAAACAMTLCWLILRHDGRAVEPS